MKNELIKDILSQEDIDTVIKIINNEKETRTIVYQDFPTSYVEFESDIKVYSGTGRLDIEKIPIPDSIIDKFEEIANFGLSSKEYLINREEIMYAEYSGKYGTPELRPHHDGGNCSYMLDYQLLSNTEWAIGIEEDVYDILDNQALSLSPTKQLHWRPFKDFSDTEYVGMIFLRFKNIHEPNIDVGENDEAKNKRINKIMETYYKVKDNSNG